MNTITTITISDLKELLLNYFKNKFENKVVLGYKTKKMFSRKYKYTSKAQNTSSEEFWFKPVKIIIDSSFCLAHGRDYTLLLYYDNDNFIEYNLDFLGILYDIKYK